MNHKTLLKLTPIAASLVVAMSGYAHAAAPAATALPGVFLTNQSSGVTYSITSSNAGTIVIPSGSTVLQFSGATTGGVTNTVTPSIGSGVTAATTVAGFNIGASAALTLSGAGTSASNVLVSDLTGQASNIYGSLTATNVASLVIANPNGVVVGGKGTIATSTGQSVNNVALVGYQADAANFAGGVTVGVAQPSITGGSAGTATNGGAVTLANGATVNAGYLLVAGAGQVNVGALSGTQSILAVAGGTSFTAGVTLTSLGTSIVSPGAVVNLGGNTGSLAVASLAAAGAVNVLGTVGLSNAIIGGTLTNNANLTLGGAGTTNTINAFTNNANATVASATTTFGSVTNNANLNATNGLNFGGAFVNAGTATVGTLTGTSATTASVNNSGILMNVVGSSSVLTAGTLASFTNTGTLYDNGYGITVTAGTISLGGTVANASNSTSAVGGVTLVAQTGNLTGTANINSSSATSLTASQGNVILNGNLTAASATISATGGSVLINKNITDTATAASTDINVAAANQIMVSGNVNASSAGTVSLTTNNVWTGPYNLGVVVMPSGSVSAGTVTVNVAAAAGNAGNMLQYGGISAAGTSSGFTFTGNSYYQGAGASINTPTATFDYGNASSGGAIAGGIVFGSANPQPSNAFFNAVVVGGSNASTGVTLEVSPANLGTAMQNVNLMGIGNTTLAAGLPTGLVSLFGSTGSTVINTGFVPSNLFIRAQGGNLTLSPNSNSDFYWPGLVYASTVQAGKVATVDTTKVITVGSASGAMSNALPYQAMGGAGIYLMTGKVNVGSGGITVNTNSNVSVLNPLQVAGVNLYTASAPTGLVLNYNATLPAANVVSYTPPAN
jgi:filamentous hemagglutinin family protein